MEILLFVGAVILVGLFILPTKKITGKSHYARPEGCTCYSYTAFSMDVNPDCPVHGDWMEPLYPIDEIKATSEKEAACIKAGLEYNKILKDKWEGK